MKRALLRWLLDGEDVYFAVLSSPPEPGSTFVLHTTFEGASEDLAGVQGKVMTGTLVVD